MSDEYLYVYPNCDIHLVLSLPIIPMKLTVKKEYYSVSQGKWLLKDISTDPNTMYEVYDPIKVKLDPGKVTIKNGYITPLKVGETIVRIKHRINPSKPEYLYILVRVKIHQSIKKIWIGNNRATVHQGLNNYVLTVFAQFDDGTIEDISSHGYLKFQSSDPTKISVDKSGRLKGIKQDESFSLMHPIAGPYTVKVTYKYDNKLTDSVNCYLREKIDKERQILKFRYPKNSTENRLKPFNYRNILILSEGFSISEKPKFEQCVEQIIYKLFNTNTQRPYNLLKERMNIWSAFVESPESGVTVCNPITKDGLPVPSKRSRLASAKEYGLNKLISFVGLPNKKSPKDYNQAKSEWQNIPGFDVSKLSSKIFDEWKLQVIEKRLRPRDSFFGLSIGSRFGDQYSTSNKYPINIWYVCRSRISSLDTRRCDENFEVTKKNMRAFIKSLKPMPDSNPGSVDITKTWMEGEKDNMLVCFLVNEQYGAGSQDSYYGYFAISIGADRKYILTSTESLTDHKPKVDKPNFDIITSSFVHELGHALDLLDEYEAFDDPFKTSPPYGDKEKMEDITGCFNLTHFGVLADTSSYENLMNRKIIADKIKWNWPRIKRGSMVLKVTKIPGAKIKLTLRKNEGNKWKKNEKNFFLRSPEINPDHTTKGKQIEISEIVDQDNNNRDIIIVKPKTGAVFSAADFPMWSFFYEPKKKENNILTVIDPIIMQHIKKTGDPFEKKPGCEFFNYEAGYPDDNIIGFNYPPNRYEVIGAYEGGGTYNCSIYRPAGACKMRFGKSFRLNHIYFGILRELYHWDYDPERHSHFCFVCKYAILNAIDPSKLDSLDKLYPVFK